jgi:uncharacterized protein
MIKNLLFRGLLLQLLLLTGLFSASAQTVFINEIHYDNASTDVGEAIEIAGPAGTDLTGWSLVLYNGNGGGVYNTRTLSGTLADAGSGFGFMVLEYPTNGIQNGGTSSSPEPDGIALVDASGAVVQFLSYEGVMTASNGPALGMLSTDIGVFQNGSGAVGQSLQLTGTGTRYTDFIWVDEATNTFGAANNNQVFGTGGNNPDPEPKPEEPGEPEQPTPIGATTVFINEIHYDNTGADVDEGVEVAGPAGTDLAGWQLIPYNGANGLSYAPIITLNGILEDQQAGWGTHFFPISGLQNGSPDGIALVNAAGEVVQFLSYEGTFTAMNGPAAGMLSTDIGVFQPGTGPIGYSLQLSGTGKTYADFTWTAEAASTYNAPNNGQTFLPLTPVVFINEIHYDNIGTDTGEAIEIAGTAGTDLTGWKLLLYNGASTSLKVYNTRILSGSLSDAGNGWGFVVENYPSNGIQNGDPDGIALVDAAGSVVQFLSYGGTFVAADGEAVGMESTDIGVKQSNATTPIGHSLQLSGSGTTYSDFSWVADAPHTFGRSNNNQSFGTGGTNPDPEPEEPQEPQESTIAAARLLPLGTQVIINGTLTVVDQLGGPAFIQDNTGGIALFDYQVHAPNGFSIGDSIRVMASIGAFQQMVQLVEVSELSFFGPASAPIDPRVVQVSELSAYEGQLISIQQASFADLRGLLFPESNYRITDGTGTADIRIDASVESLIGRYKPQEPATITGVLGSFRGALQLFPRFIEDLPGTTPYAPAGSDIPVSSTLDVMSWNIAFFGSTLANFGPADVQRQKENAKTVIQNSQADIIALQEISDDSLLLELAEELGYALMCSDRFSYSFNEPDPTFPEQKVCFIYNPAVVSVVSARAMFAEMYDAARSGENTPLDAYPTGSPSSFWSSGRLPYMITVDATIGGITERIHLVNIHAKSGSAANDLRRRRFDVQALKDSLDRYYPNDNIILLGDYNDDVDVSIGGGASTYSVFVDAPDFKVVTATLSEAGMRSFITQDNVIDHIAISNELYDNHLAGTETLIIPFTYIWNYLGTTSDHLPVLTRFEFYTPLSAAISGGNIVYAGYAPEACTTLTASASGGKGAYTYSWSTGDSSSALSVCPQESVTYTLTVSDEGGNSTTVGYDVCAIDVRCEEDKVQLCWKPNPNKNKYSLLCMPEHMVAFYLNRGASLGQCFAEQACNTTVSTANARSGMATTAAELAYVTIDSELSVSPSLAHSWAKVDFVVLEEGRTTLKVYALSGQEMATLYDGVDPFGTARSTSLRVDHFKAGLYIVKMTTASGAVFSSKLMVAR